MRRTPSLYNPSQLDEDEAGFGSYAFTRTQLNAPPHPPTPRTQPNEEEDEEGLVEAVRDGSGTYFEDRRHMAAHGGSGGSKSPGPAVAAVAGGYGLGGGPRHQRAASGVPMMASPSRMWVAWGRWGRGGARGLRSHAGCGGVVGAQRAKGAFTPIHATPPPPASPPSPARPAGAPRPCCRHTAAWAAAATASSWPRTMTRLRLRRRRCWRRRWWARRATPRATSTPPCSARSPAGAALCACVCVALRTWAWAGVGGGRACARAEPVPGQCSCRPVCASSAHHPRKRVPSQMALSHEWLMAT